MSYLACSKVYCRVIMQGGYPFLGIILVSRLSVFHDSGDNDEKSLSDILVTSVSDYALKDSRLSTYVDYLDGPVLS